MAVHGGASFSFSSLSLAVSCLKALKMSTNVVQAITIMENDGLFNCGYGSNLNKKGTVECEAAFMTSTTGRFGSVGGVKRLQNPLEVAVSVATSDDESYQGLIQPFTLLAEGAEEYAESRGFKLINNEELISEDAIKRFERARNKISEFRGDSLDTVGGIEVDTDSGECSAAVSSGGIQLKLPGRGGHSIQYGAAIWAEKRKMPWGVERSVSISLSGCGEVIILTNLAKELSSSVLQCGEDDIPFMEVMKKYNHLFDIQWNKPLRCLQEHQKSVAGIMYILDSKKSSSKVSNEAENSVECVELLVFHNTPFFPLAYTNRKGERKKIVSKCNVEDKFYCHSIGL